MDRLEYYRNAVNEIDGQLRSLLLARMELSRKIGRWKERQNLAVYDPQREEAVLRAVAKDLPVPEGQSMQEIWRIIFRESRKLQFVYRESEDRY